MISKEAKQCLINVEIKYLKEIIDISKSFLVLKEETSSQMIDICEKAINELETQVESEGEEIE